MSYRVLKVRFLYLKIAMIGVSNCLQENTRSVLHSEPNDTYNKASEHIPAVYIEGHP